MRYRVVFAKRFQSNGQESPIDPTAELDGNLSDGVVAEKAFVERLEPAANHGQEVLDEDDEFLAVAVLETWEYEVVDNRAAEFVDAMRNGRVVANFEMVDESETSADDASGVAPGDSAGGSAGDSTAGEIDELNVVSADDPRLGLTGSEAPPARAKPPQSAGKSGRSKKPKVRNG